MNTAIKIGLIGAGAYLLITRTSIFSGSAAAAPAAGAAGGGVPPVGAGGAPAVRPATATVTPIRTATPSVPPADVSGLLPAAAMGDPNAVAIVRAAGVRVNSDYWNEYRNQGGGGITTTDLFPAGNRDYQMTIDEYLAARAGAGLSGIRTWR